MTDSRVTNDVDISVEAVDQLTFGQEYTNPNVKMIRALRSALTAEASRVAELEAQLAEARRG